MIKLLLNKFNNISQSISWFIGSVAIMFFIYMMVTGQNPNILINWGVSTLGLLFIVDISKFEVESSPIPTLIPNKVNVNAIVEILFET